MDLKSIILSLTPENLRSIPVLNIALNIFLDCIKRNNEVAQRIISLYEVSEYDTDSEMLKNSKNILKQGLYYTWIYTLYNCLNKLAEDTQIQADLEKYNYTEAGIYQGINHIVSPEFVSANRIFSQKVGTKQALKYMYYFGKYLETGQYEDDLDIKEDNPFIIFYEGSMSKKMFRGIVKPMAHPIGWIDTYTQIVSLILNDFFGIEIFKSYEKIELQNKEKWVVFIYDENIDAVYEDFRNRINPLTNKPYTDAEIKENVNIITGKVVRSFDQKLNEDGSIDKIIVFEDNTVLYNFGYPEKKTIFTTYEDYLNGFLEPIIVWGADWTFYGDLSSNFKFLYTDTINEFEKEFYITKIKEENSGKCDLSTYVENDSSNMFKVGGDEYPFVFGSDESRYVVNNYDEVNKTVQEKFNCSLNYNLKRACTIIIEDDFQNKKFFKFNDAGKGTFNLNTFDLQGFNYKVTINEIAGMKYWFRLKGLNEFEPKIKFTNVFTENNILRISGYANFETLPLETFSGRHDVSITHESGVDDILNTLLDEAHTYDDETETNLGLEYLHLEDNDYIQFCEFVVTDSENKTKTYIQETPGDFILELPIDDFASGKFRIDARIKNYKKRIFAKTFFEGLDLKLYSDLEPKVSFLTYGTKPVFTFDKSELNHISNLRGTYSTADYVNFRIGELHDGKFAKPDGALIDYVPKNKPDDYNIFTDPNLANFIFRGAYFEGVNYNSCTWKDLPEEECFINAGFAFKTIPTSDFIISDSDRYVTDDLDIQLMSSAYYLYTDVDINDDNVGKYLYTSDNFYLYTKENHINLTFETFGGTIIKNKTVEKNSRWKNVKEILKTPEKTGYVFSHWSLSDDGNEIDDLYRFTNDTILYAVYNDDTNIITVSFDLHLED